MVQNGQITLYTNPNSAFCHRVEIALAEAKADYTSYVIDLNNKPSWYAAKVNPVGKVPAITYGGPQTAPEAPAPESAKIAESLVILEFLADIFPESRLLPADPVLRAQARLFIAATDRLLFGAFIAFFFKYTEGADQVLLDALEEVQRRLPPTGFAIGIWSNADISVAPLLVCFLLMLKHDLGKYPAGQGPKILEILQGPRFARLMEYIHDLEQWPSVRGTWNEVSEASYQRQNR
ncbi:glutathione transferase omega class [Trametes coccinea BRFM310]|uniref:Glutathione transferase omega class n=1 Tax=Trametes coccinea (strain BRFM310) TaxID=1353009 RepID=A0A1Y2INA8_TRAC3|nr:glutathione transferase omega class [Trametes coccinea BRFM310]